MITYRAIVEFLDVPVTSAWTMTPAQALDFLKSKGLKTSFSYGDLVAAEHAQAFTIAKMMDTDLLADVQASLSDALANGTTFAEWSKTITPMLQEKGWWGMKQVVSPDGNLVNAHLGSPARLQTIYRTNMQSAYTSGQWDSIVSQSDIAPYLMYDAVDDFRTRPLHHSWDNTVLPVDHPWWRTHYPPNGWNCRCSIIQLSDDDLESMGIKKSDAPPDDGTYQWTNPATGKTVKLPNGIDPGFNVNLGELRSQALAKVVKEKLAGYSAEIAAPAAEGMANAAAAGRQAAAFDQAEAIAAQGVADASKVARGAMKAQARAADNAITKHLTDSTPYLANAIKALKATKTGAAMNNVDLLEAAHVQAAKTKAAADLAHYKQALLKGKAPPTAAKEAFDALPATAQQTITEQIQGKLAADQVDKAASAALEAIAAGEKGQLQMLILQKLVTEGAITNKGDLLAAVDSGVEKIAKGQAKAKNLAGAKQNILANKALTPEQAATVKALADDEAEAFVAGIQKAKDAAIKKQAKEAAAAQALKAAETAKEAKLIDDLLTGKASGLEAIPETALKPVKVPKATKAKAKPAAVEPPDQPVNLAAPAVNPDKLVQIGPQTGSNPGGLYLDTDTQQQWYVKIPASAEQARNEVLAAKLYRLAGVDVPDLEMITFQGKPAIASKIVDGLSKSTGAKLAKTAGAADNFVVDAWLGNWDVAGATFDNMLVKEGRAFRVDTGGALRFRAQGGAKGTAWGDSVTELDSLRDASINRQTSAIFGKVTEKQMQDNARRLLAIDRTKIDALVDQVGPLNAADREAMKLTLRARLDDIANKLKVKAEVEAPPAPPIEKPGKFLTAAQLKEVKASRSNGYTVSTDGGAIEDHQVLIQHLTGADGKPRTRVVLKLRDQGAQDVTKKLGAIAGEAKTSVVDVEPLHQTIIALAKSINTRAGKPLALDDSTLVTRLTNYNASLASVRKQIAAAGNRLGSGAQAKLAMKTIDDFDAAVKTWQSQWKAAAGKAKTGVVPKIPFVHTQNLVDIPIAQAAAAKNTLAGMKWRSAANFDYAIAKNVKGNMIETKNINTLPAVKHVVVGEGDGIRVRFITDQETNSISSRGLVHIDVDGTDMGAIDRAMKALSDMGVTTTTTTEGQRLELYLDKIANLRTIKKADGKLKANYAELAKIPDEAQRNAAKLALLNKDVGYDMAKSPYWSPEGQRQAFGHGRTLQMRPDMDGKDWDDFEKTTTVYTNVTGLGTSAGNDQWERLLGAIDGGGQLSSQMERARRGIESGGSSVTADHEAGGANYVFTRLRPSTADTPGVYFRPKVARRIDAFSYNGDMFGSVDQAVQARARQTSAAGMNANKKNARNETNFRDSLSLFDDLERIIFRTETERTKAIADMRARGYTTWPDGRPLKDVLQGPKS